MAQEIVQFEGGPDAGVEITYNVPPALPANIDYSGSVYANEHKTKVDSTGLTVHLYSYTGPKVSGTATAPHAHKGWADLQRAMNRRWHPALTKSAKLQRSASQSLTRASKVRL